MVRRLDLVIGSPFAQGPCERRQHMGRRNSSQDILTAFDCTTDQAVGRGGPNSVVRQESEYSRIEDGSVVDKHAPQLLTRSRRTAMTGRSAIFVAANWRYRERSSSC